MKTFNSMRGIMPQSVNRRNIDSFFNDAYRRMLGSDHSISGDELTIPSANIQQKDSTYVIELAVPGMHKEDISVDVYDDRLNVSAERQLNNSNDNQQHYSRREFHYASFSRSFSLPDSVDEDNIKARYENGILEIEIPVRGDMEESSTPRKINIS